MQKVLFGSTSLEYKLLKSKSFVSFVPAIIQCQKQCLVHRCSINIWWWIFKKLSINKNLSQILGVIYSTADAESNNAPIHKKLPHLVERWLHIQLLDTNQAVQMTTTEVQTWTPTEAHSWIIHIRNNKLHFEKIQDFQFLESRGRKNMKTWKGAYWSKASRHNYFLQEIY